ncbi:MAG: aspartate aminotransferase family protein [Anaerolineae bacterium]|nr:aspartate aminotransferase family protein [Anaerolineae bacterium]
MAIVDWNAVEEQHSSGAYLKRDIQIVRGVGARLFDEAGRSYIDCVGGQGSANLGHAHPAIVEAITRQAGELMVCPELFHNPVRARYQAELCRVSGFPRVFLCNSGAEANEGALKIARLKSGRRGVIAAMRGFHGRTMGALSATWEKAYREPFLPLIDGVVHVPYNHIDKLREALTDQIGAVLLEVVQGEGGVHPAQAGYLQAAQELCRANGTLLIIDEVQTGWGRTGTLFAHWQDGIQPDIVTTAKSMAGGLPMGAILLSERIGALDPATHGSTFGGNPLACAAGLAALEVYTEKFHHRGTEDTENTEQDEGLIERVKRLGEEARAHLAAHVPEKAAREVRGRGFMFGIELRGKVAPVLKALQERGVLALPAGPSVLRLLPPLVITDEDLWQAIQIIEETLNDVF